MNFKPILLAAIVTIGFSGCGSTEQPTSNTRVERVKQMQSAQPGNAAVNATQPLPEQRPTPGPTSILNGAATSPSPGTAQVSTPASDPEATDMIDPRRRKLEMIKEARLNAQSGPPPKPIPQPAPDNSVYTVILADAVRETRVFNSHPRLLKVEKVTDAKGSAMRVFLKGGNVISLPGDRIQSLATAPASAIMTAAGVPQQGDSRRDSSKKPEANP